MYIQQLYTGCLSEAAYYIESNGEAAVIDPLRDIDNYLQIAKERNSTIRYIFETHFHADFVSGHLELGKLTGAPIIFGPNTVTSYPIHIAKDGEVFKLGAISIEVLHTPGHTIESSCYLLKDEHNSPKAIFTGDTLFVGDVGRPDLSSGNLDKEKLAGILYESIQNKILPLADDIVVYPAHGPGSSCGKNLGKETYTTIGNQKRTNYALKTRDKKAFIKAVFEGLDDVPEYFLNNARINKEGYDSLDSIKQKSLNPVSLDELIKALKKSILLDTRPVSDFVEGFIPGSIFIGLEGRFAEWAGSFLPFDQSIYFVAEEGKEEEAVVRLARVGFTNVEGYLKGGFDTWKKSGEQIDMIINIEPSEVEIDLKFDKNLEVIDVRREAEFANGHIKDSVNIPLSNFKKIEEKDNLDIKKNLYLICSSGYRSVIAASILKRKGIHNLYNVVGGWNRLKEESAVSTEKDSTMLN